MDYTQVENEFQKKQRIYLKTRTNTDLWNLYPYIKDCLKNMTYKKYGRIAIDIDDKINDAALNTINKYIKTPGFKIEKLTSYLHFVMIGVMHNRQTKFHEKLIEINYDFFHSEPKVTLSNYSVIYGKLSKRCRKRVDELRERHKVNPITIDCKTKRFFWRAMKNIKLPHGLKIKIAEQMIYGVDS